MNVYQINNRYSQYTAESFKLLHKISRDTHNKANHDAISNHKQVFQNIENNVRLHPGTGSKSVP